MRSFGFFIFFENSYALYRAVIGLSDAAIRLGAPNYEFGTMNCLLIFFEYVYRF